VATTNFLDRATDVAAFAKNAGPQALRIDYLTTDHRLALYTPDFFVRGSDGDHYVVETKGRQDHDVPRKASAAIEWCKSASRPNATWHYVFIPQAVMEGLKSYRFADLVRACAPALQNLLSETSKAPELPLFGEGAKEKAEQFYTPATLAKLSQRERKAAEDAAELFRYFESKSDGPNFAPAFNVLLGPFDEAAKGAILGSLQSNVPADRNAQQIWFEPSIDHIDRHEVRHYQGMANNLKRALLYGNVHSAIGLLRSCLDFALNDKTVLEGVFSSVRSAFKVSGARQLLDRITAVNDLRNTYVAHHEKDLTDKALARGQLKAWVETLALLRK
jgi:type III restriction enzyme